MLEMNILIALQEAYAEMDQYERACDVCIVGGGGGIPGLGNRLRKEGVKIRELVVGGEWAAWLGGCVLAERGAVGVPVPDSIA